MKAVVWEDKNIITLKNVSDPVPEDGEVLIKVQMTGICGSDITIVSGKHPRARTPLILGHEFVGIVEKINGKSDTVKPGDRVAVEPLLSCGKCRHCMEGNAHVCSSLKLLGVEAPGAFAEYSVAPINKVYKLPDNVSDVSAVLVEPLSVAMHTINCSNISRGEDVSVIGAGPIGLLCAEVAKAKGAGKVFIIEINENRIAMAEKMGFEVIDVSKNDPVEYVLKKTEGKGVEITIDAAGSKQTGMLLVPMTSIKGRIMMAALHKEPCEINFQQLSYREQAIIGIRIYAKGDFKEAIEMLADGKLNIETLVTGIFTMDQYLMAFDKAKNDPAECKVVIKQYM